MNIQTHRPIIDSDPYISPASLEHPPSTTCSKFNAALEYAFSSFEFTKLPTASVASPPEKLLQPCSSAHARAMVSSSGSGSDSSRPSFPSGISKSPSERTFSLSRPRNIMRLPILQRLAQRSAPSPSVTSHAYDSNTRSSSSSNSNSNSNTSAAAAQSDGIKSHTQNSAHSSRETLATVRPRRRSSLPLPDMADHELQVPSTSHSDPADAAYLSGSEDSNMQSPPRANNHPYHDAVQQYQQQQQQQLLLQHHYHQQLQQYQHPPPPPQPPQQQQHQYQPQHQPHDDHFESYEDEMVSMASTSIRQANHEYIFENGRRYHWFKEGSYNFPNDDEEQENEHVKHTLVNLLFEDALHFAPLDEEPQRILDLGTGTGAWAIDIADKYPSAMVKGIDLSPIQPNWVPPNVRFLVDDMEGSWFYSQPFDLIHARHAALAVRNWPQVLANSFNNLKPDGWLELQELDYVPYSHNADVNIAETPVGQYWQLVRQGLTALGVSVNVVAGGRLASQLAEVGLVNVREELFQIPIGAWAGDEGVPWRRLFLDSIQATALGPLTRGLGWSREQVELFLVKVRQSFMDDSLRLGMTMHVVYGQRP